MMCEKCTEIIEGKEKDGRERREGKTIERDERTHTPRVSKVA